MKNKSDIKWLEQPEEHNYPAAVSYLSLIYPEAIAKKMFLDLMKANIVEFKAKDIFRAANLPLLPATNLHVKKDSDKIAAGKELSPILLVRDSKNGKVIIADGYHRMCSVYTLDEDAIIPCKIISHID